MPILNLTASFQLPEEGLEHVDSPMPDVTPPDDLRPDIDMRREIADQWGDRLNEAQRRLMLRPRPIEMRTIDRLHWMSSELARTARGIAGSRSQPPINRRG